MQNRLVTTGASSSYPPHLESSSSKIYPKKAFPQREDVYYLLRAHVDSDDPPADAVPRLQNRKIRTPVLGQMVRRRQPSHSSTDYDHFVFPFLRRRTTFPRTSRSLVGHGSVVVANPCDGDTTLLAPAPITTDFPEVFGPNRRGEKRLTERNSRPAPVKFSIFFHSRRTRRKTPTRQPKLLECQKGKEKNK